MYNKLQLAGKYLKYFITASNGKGHGVHSPFVFNFITRVLNDKRHFYSYDAIESVRNAFTGSTERILVEDYGAGSGAFSTAERSVKTIAQWSLKPAKYAQLIFRIAHYYQPATIVELGTSLGITTSYLAAANHAAQVYSLEGAPNIAAIAQKTFQKLQLNNIQLITGNFDDTLLPLLKKTVQADLVFVDGNHRKVPTVKYFNWLLPHMHAGSIIIFDDIHWSAEMEQAWAEISGHSAVTCSIDLFFIGIVFFNPDFKIKQQFRIRF